jgi:hypothetical protein
MTLFMRMLSVTPEIKILDVGGTPYNWLLVNCPAKITMLNSRIQSPLPELPANISYIQGDGKDCNFLITHMILFFQILSLSTCIPSKINKNLRMKHAGLEKTCGYKHQHAPSFLNHIS